MTQTETLPPLKADSSRYSLVRFLRPWELGAEYLAHDEETNRAVVVKMVANRPSLIAALEPLKLQAHLVSSLEHPSILPIFDSRLENSLPAYIVTEAYSENSLGSALYSIDTTKLDFDLCHVFSTVVEALLFAHSKGVLHFNLRPEQVVLSVEGNWKISDFGYSHALLAEQKVSMGDFRTLRSQDFLYWAPELCTPAFPSATVDHRVDIYSVGMLAFELLGGFENHPSIGDIALGKLRHPSPLDMHPNELPEEIRSVLRHATMNDPSQRLCNLGELSSVISPVLQQLRH